MASEMLNPLEEWGEKLTKFWNECPEDFAHLTRLLEEFWEVLEEVDAVVEQRIIEMEETHSLQMQEALESAEFDANEIAQAQIEERIKQYEQSWRDDPDPYGLHGLHKQGD